MGRFPPKARSTPPGLLFCAASPCARWYDGEKQWLGVRQAITRVRPLVDWRSGDKRLDDLQDSLRARSILHAFRNVLPNDATVAIDQNHGRQGDVRIIWTGPFVKQAVFPNDVTPGVAQDREIELIPHRDPFVFGDRIDGNRQQRTRVFHELQMNFSETSELRETR